MRIAVSNPDNLGDFVVRQPMLAALVEAGHEVLLIVRAFVAPLAAWSVPGASILLCAGDPYSPRFNLSSSPDDRLITAVQAFDPDIFVVAAYQHTQLEEQLANHLPRAQAIGFGGELRQNDGSLGITHVSSLRLAVRVLVGREWHESRKNELLCGAILGKSISLSPPRLVAEKRFVDMASERVRREGLQKRKFWVVCAGEGSEYTRLKNWTLEKWAELCTVLVREDDLHLIFVGTESEHESTAAIRALMGDAAKNTLDMTAQADGLDMMIGLLSLSGGYLGKDTGPMHVAAGLGKPVVSVFGGGHWPRFLPAPVRGAVITMRVPCVDCDWICPYKTSHCVKDVPLAPVLAAVRAALSGGQVGFETVLLEPGEWISRAMALEAAETARAAMHTLTVERSNFHQWHSDRVNDIAGLRQQIAQLEAQKQEFAGERQGWSDSISQLGGETARLCAERVELQRALGEREEKLAQVRGVSAEVSTEMNGLRRQLSALEQAVDAGKAIEKRLARLRERSARKLLDGRAQLAALQRTVGELNDGNTALRERLENALGELAIGRGEVVRLDRECSENAAALDAANVKLNSMSSREQGAIADLRQQLLRKDTELKSVLALVPDLRDELDQSRLEMARLLHEAGRIEGLESSLRERQETIDRLEEHLCEVEADRAERLGLIEASADRIEALAQDQQAKQQLIEQLSATLAEVEADRAERLVLIEASARRLEELAQDQQAKQQLIEQLSATLAEAEADRAERLGLIEASARRLEELAQDQQAKQELVEQLSGTLAEVEADRAERLTLIERLSARLAVVEGDHTERGTQIEMLNQIAGRQQAEIAALQEKILPRLTRLVRRR